MNSDSDHYCVKSFFDNHAQCSRFTALNDARTECSIYYKFDKACPKSSNLDSVFMRAILVKISKLEYLWHTW